MKIKELTVTNEEVAEAVGHWLATTQGIAIPVKEINKEYSWMREWSVTLDIPDETKPTKVAPEPMPKDAEPTSIELPTVADENLNTSVS